MEVIWWSEVVYYLHYTLEAFAKIDDDNWNVLEEYAKAFEMSIR